MSRTSKIAETIVDPPPLVRDEFTRLAPGKVAAVITHLHMYARPQLRPEPAGDRFTLARAQRPDLGWYRNLYRRVGQQWLWFSRLTLNDEALARLIHDPKVEVHALGHRGRDAGMLELDLRRHPDVEISFLGVVSEFLGTGAGRFLMNRALQIAWSRNPRRVTVHTCTLDHPKALAFYLRSGFVPYARSVEVADDPRLLGLLPRSAAPHVPITESK
ncbi:MAG: GNAT family N-acetyltransferase [Xanthobacteraceae bacterium]